MKKFHTLIVLLSFYKNVIVAQDTNYWTNQFGPRCSILGNAIIGSVKDNSSIYYNPGYLAMVDSNNISISASVYQYDMLNVRDGAGIGLDLKSSQTQILPSLVSGTYQFKKSRKHKFGYCILTKNQTGIKTSSRIDQELNIIPDFNNEGNEDFIGQFALKTTLNEQWFGGCYSYKFDNQFSVGFTALVSTTTVNGGIKILQEAVIMLSSTAFDRSLEKEVDIKAVDYLLKAKVSPISFSDFLFKFSDKENEVTKSMNWISRHPNSKERAKYLIEYYEDKDHINENVISINTWLNLKETINQ
jgi:hypothetical protein